MGVAAEAPLASTSVAWHLAVRRVAYGEGWKGGEGRRRWREKGWGKGSQGWWGNAGFVCALERDTAIYVHCFSRVERAGDLKGELRGTEAIEGEGR